MKKLNKPEESKSVQCKQSKYNEHFERINATPEQVAKIIINSPPKKSSDWKYKTAAKKD